MAIGSQPPIGESFGRFKVTNNLIDREEYDKWAEWFGDMVANHGLLFGEAKIIVPGPRMQKWEHVRTQREHPSD